MISRSEWHPFSIIQVPGKVSRAAFYAEAVRGKEDGGIGNVARGEDCLGRPFSRIIFNLWGLSEAAA